jgi:hypothetical protein
MTIASRKSKVEIRNSARHVIWSPSLPNTCHPERSEGSQRPTPVAEPAAQNFFTRGWSFSSHVTTFSQRVLAPEETFALRFPEEK